MNHDDKHSLHGYLRQATRSAHQQLDQHPLLRPLLHPTLTREAYADALAALHGVYGETERVIMASLAGLPGWFDYSTRRKLPALEQDLQTLQRAPWPLQQTLAAPEDRWELIGYLYTLEGSTLGGQQIARKVRETLGEQVPLAFFHGHGAQSGELWQHFLQFAQAASPPTRYAAVAHGACRVFALFQAHLDQRVAHA